MDIRILATLGIPDGVITKYEPHAKSVGAKAKAGRFNLHGAIVTDVTAEALDLDALVNPAKFAAFLADAEGDVTIDINSPGGSVYAAVSMVNELRRYEGGAVNLVVSGLAASAATFFLTLNSASRVGMPSSEYMIHEPQGIALGDSDSLRREADALDKTAGTMVREYSKVMDANESEVRALMRSETWFTDEEAAAIGLVDSLYEEPEPEAEPMATAAGLRGAGLQAVRLALLR